MSPPRDTSIPTPASFRTPSVAHAATMPLAAFALDLRKLCASTRSGSAVSTFCALPCVPVWPCGRVRHPVSIRYAYLCDGMSTSIRPSWKLLGYFAPAACASLATAALDPGRCPVASDTPTLAPSAAPTALPSPAPSTPPSSSPSTEPPTEADETFSPTFAPISSEPTLPEPTSAPATSTPTTTEPTTSAPTASPSTAEPAVGGETASPTSEPNFSEPTSEPNYSEPPTPEPTTPTTVAASAPTLPPSPMPPPTAAPTGGNLGTSGRSSGGDDDDGAGATVAIVVVVILLLIGAMVAAAVAYKKKRAGAVPEVNKPPTEPQWRTDGRNGYAAHENLAYDIGGGGGGTSAHGASTRSVVLGADGTFRQGHAAD